MLNTFTLLFVKLIPLYLLIISGYVLAKKTKIDKETIATLLIYFLSPVVVFYGTTKAPNVSTLVIIPILFFILCATIGISFYFLSKIWFKDQKSIPNLLGFMAGSGNTGYFGLPLVIAMLGESQAYIAILCTLGLVIFENTLGYYFIAKNNFSIKEIWAKIVRLPVLYAYLFGLLLYIINLTVPTNINDIILNIRGAYIVLGMMLIGISLANIAKFKINKTFNFLAFVAKFIAYPLATLVLIFIDNLLFGILDNSAKQVLLLLSITPLATNSVAYAIKLKVLPEQAAFAVLASTIFALFYIPLFIYLFL